MTILALVVVTCLLKFSGAPDLDGQPVPCPIRNDTDPEYLCPIKMPGKPWTNGGPMTDEKRTYVMGNWWAIIGGVSNERLLPERATATRAAREMDGKGCKAQKHSCLSG